MLQSKYGIFCLKRLLKYSTTDIRSQIIDAMLGNAVKLASHILSSPILEYAYSTWATSVQKQYFVQEFFGDLYKKMKDSDIKHLRDIYKHDSSLKAATLGKKILHFFTSDIVVMVKIYYNIGQSDDIIPIFCSYSFLN